MGGFGFDALYGVLLLVVCYFGKWVFEQNMTVNTFGERHTNDILSLLYDNVN